MSDSADSMETVVRAAIFVVSRRYRQHSEPPTTAAALEAFALSDQARLERAMHRVWPKTKAAPPKPNRTPDSIDFEDYGYYLPTGRFRFWIGYDAKFKSILMQISRSPDDPRNDRAMRELAARCWSTPEYEREIRDRNARRALRAEESKT